MDDWNLLQEYVQCGSRAALDELVRRHVGMVYAAASRQVGDPHLAEDVTQAVFLILMRRAKNISDKVVLGGWLFHVTRYAAADARKQRVRRQRHEQQAAAMKPMTSDSGAAAAERLTAALDEAVASLSRGDRDAVVMRYMQGKTCREVAEAQHITEAAARQRLSRALAKMRTYLLRKKISVTDDILSVALAATPAHVQTMDMVARITASLHAPLAPTHSAAFADSTWRTMMMITKLKVAATLVAILACLGLCGMAVMRFAEAQTVPDHPGSALVVASGFAQATKPVDNIVPSDVKFAILQSKTTYESIKNVAYKYEIYFQGPRFSQESIGTAKQSASLAGEAKDEEL